MSQGTVTIQIPASMCLSGWLFLRLWVPDSVVVCVCESEWVFCTAYPLVPIKLFAFDALFLWFPSCLQWTIFYPSMLFFYKYFNGWMNVQVLTTILFIPSASMISLCHLCPLFKIGHLTIVSGVEERGRRWNWAEICQISWCSPTLLPHRSVLMKVKHQSYDTCTHKQNAIYVLMVSSYNNSTFFFRHCRWRSVFQWDQSTVSGESQNRRVPGF